MAIALETARVPGAEAKPKVIKKAAAKKASVQKMAKQTPVKAASAPAPMTSEVLYNLLSLVRQVNFSALTRLQDGEKLTQKHYIVGVVKVLLAIAKESKHALCMYNEAIYVYTGQYWKMVDSSVFRQFLGRAAELMGVDEMLAAHYQFQLQLFKQFLAAANLSAPKRHHKATLINLKNGTFEVTAEGSKLREFRASDFLTYQLPFAYDDKAKAAEFTKYLDKVLPAKELQVNLSEYLGYVFAKEMKLEKCLLLYGSGANGKSVFFDIINALLGRENVSNFSLSDLGAEHNRAQIGNKLINYGSEIRSSIESDLFKQLASGEPVQARMKYQNAVTITDYARLMFNCNELPATTDQTEAYFRRFLIIPFEVTIAEKDRDRDLAPRIIAGELSGVFNWVLAGLKSILKNRAFSASQRVADVIQTYKQEADTVFQFLEDANLEPSKDKAQPFATIFEVYRKYCNANGFRALTGIKFSKKIREHKFAIERVGQGGTKHIFLQTRTAKKSSAK